MALRNLLALLIIVGSVPIAASPSQASTIRFIDNSLSETLTINTTLTSGYSTFIQAPNGSLCFGCTSLVADEASNGSNPAGSVTVGLDSGSTSTLPFEVLKLAPGGGDVQNILNFGGLTQIAQPVLEPGTNILSDLIVFSYFRGSTHYEVTFFSDIPGQPIVIPPGAILFQPFVEDGTLQLAFEVFWVGGSHPTIDAIFFQSDVDPRPPTVPESSTLLMLLSGLAGLCSLVFFRGVRQSTCI